MSDRVIRLPALPEGYATGPPEEVVHLTEYVTREVDRGELAEARDAYLRGRRVPVSTVPVEGFPGTDASYAVEPTLSPYGSELVETGAGPVRVADGVVHLPGLLPPPGQDFQQQYRSCLEQTDAALRAVGLGLASLVRTVDYTATATRTEYPRCGRPRRELLGGTGDDGDPVFPGAAGILVDHAVRPGVMVSLDATASTEPLRTVNPGWGRYATLTYRPGVLAGRTLFMSGFGALDPVTQRAVFPGDLLAQAEYVYTAIHRVLREAGLGGGDVVRLVEYVTPGAVAGYAALAEVRDRFFGRPDVALTSVVCSALLRPEFLIEVVPTAVAGGGR
ncbi:Rid family hydrolase [Streptosporangium sp. NBC_01639]|uniref:RidA family protein n=1 Tax=Streptosporangium sp. NBC_01639 TaxID=2975948 RepID=UPI00386F3F14|nr:Rid family hydrolase [Streptosporangium sp. NBC_01639]